MAEPGDDGWFGPGSTIWAVHADAATLVGGVRALLVQAMHPTVLAGFDQHSDYREDPESRLQRTAAFVTVTTFGTSAQAGRRLRSGTPGARPRPRPHPRRASRTTPATPSCSAGCTSRWPTRSRWRSVATGGPRSTWTPTSPTWRSSGSGSAPPTSRTTRAGLAAAWAHYRPQLAVTEPTAAAHAFLLDPPLPPTDPVALPGDRGGRGRDAAARRSGRCCPADRCCRDLPARVVGRAATRLLAGGTRREPRRGGRPPPYRDSA